MAQNYYPSVTKVYAIKWLFLILFTFIHESQLHACEYLLEYFLLDSA